MDGNANYLGRGPIGSRYDLLRVIDRGGYAIVYEAEDRRLHKSVAMKTVLPDHPDPAAGARLTREAHVMASITHPNVCGVSDIGTLEDGRPYFIMERLQGETLRSLLNRELVVEAEVAVDMMLELLSALHTVHAGGIVHRDVKPENVFLAERNSCHPAVKLLDFGCCGPMAAAPQEDTLTRDWHVVGTAAYMAPEQAAGSRTFHAGIDVFAAALVLLEMLTGFRPEGRKGSTEVFPSLSTFRNDLPTALDAVLGRALSPDPRQRYRSTVAFAKDLIEVRSICRSRSTPPISSRTFGEDRPVSSRDVAQALRGLAPVTYTEEGPPMRHPNTGAMRPRAPSYSDEGPPSRQPAISPRVRGPSYSEEGPAPRTPVPMRQRAQSNSDEAFRGPKPARTRSDRPAPPSQPADLAPPVRPMAPTIEDPTLDDIRATPLAAVAKAKRLPKDTIREHDDEDTPMAPHRSPLRAIFSS